ncbi:hypothetical protein N7510_003968 [Penicillium lagena]|uniref:uncharacterized protein n=1 Tax=Penicillium lagena TaxID=94218 RepID=UPI0025415C06|nr:uncharacterized protein N7510_003968 [Penicillium lagena]KAJ5619984.1 hypothetical protein N7510_003968 [Penicillium lagena]
MSESRLYSFSPETREKLRKFRLSTSRAKDPQAIICAIYLLHTPQRYFSNQRADIIDTKTQEIRPEDGEVYTKMEDVADELPESSPRFILLSHPLTLSSGRLSVPYVLLYYLPENCNPSQRMMYAGAVELMRSTAEVNRVVEVQSDEDVTSIESRLAGSE